MAFYTNKSGAKIDKVDGELWFHGSPINMTILRKGSSITRNKELATAFSHKPTVLSVDNDGIIQHNGILDGYLYLVDDVIGNNDIKVHEVCTLDDQWEWITKRELKLKLIEKTYVLKK